MAALEAVPDERLGWSPGEASRTPLELAAHVALTVGHMLGNLQGATFAVPTMSEADIFHRDQERALPTTGEILEKFDENTAAYFAWLDGLVIDDLGKEVVMPFGMGVVPISTALSFMAKHIDWHHAQLQYLQTVYGDRNWI